MVTLWVIRMVSSDVNKAISEWTTWAAKPEVQRYDIALLKIWIQFERFIGELFMTYATGNPSERGYSPELKIKFQDEEQFNAFMREGTKKYIEYLDKIEKLSSHIFKTNPFDVILLDADIKSSFEQMKVIRNYIAHESGEARRKFINTCFSGNEKNFVEPNDFLKSREKTTKDTYYTYYMKTIKTILDFLIEDPAKQKSQE